MLRGFYLPSLHNVSLCALQGYQGPGSSGNLGSPGSPDSSGSNGPRHTSIFRLKYFFSLVTSRYFFTKLSDRPLVFNSWQPIVIAILARKRRMRKKSWKNNWKSWPSWISVEDCKFYFQGWAIIFSCFISYTLQENKKYFFKTQEI